MTAAAPSLFDIGRADVILYANHAKLVPVVSQEKKKGRATRTHPLIP